MLSIQELNQLREISDLEQPSFPRGTILESLEDIDLYGVEELKFKSKEDQIGYIKRSALNREGTNNYIPIKKGDKFRVIRNCGYETCDHNKEYLVINMQNDKRMFMSFTINPNSKNEKAIMCSVKYLVNKK